MRAKLSVLMPVYNSFSYARCNGNPLLPKALDSLLAQSHEDFELLILDNRSSDETPKVCSSYAEKDKRVKYILDTQDRFPEEAVNHLATLMQGEYCVFANDDDLWDRRHFEKCLSALEGNPGLDMVYTNGDYIDINANPCGPLVSQSEDIYSTRSDPIENYCRYVVKRNVLPIIFGMFRSSSLRRLPPFGSFDQLRANSDNLFMARFFLAKMMSDFIDEPLFRYRRKHRYADPDAKPVIGMPALSQPERLWLFYVKHQLLFTKVLIQDAADALHVFHNEPLVRRSIFAGMVRHCYHLLNWVVQDVCQEEEDRKRLRELSAAYRKDLLPLSDPNHTACDFEKIIPGLLSMLDDVDGPCQGSGDEGLYQEIRTISEDIAGLAAQPEMRSRAPRPKKPPSVLYLPLEFRRWGDARYWSYAASWGIENALITNSCSVRTVPAVNGLSVSAPLSWLNYLKDLYPGAPFDQVWFTANHTPLDDTLLDYLAQKISVRVGIFAESLVISDEERRQKPEVSKKRDEIVARCLRVMTHAVVPDETDVRYLEQRGIPAFWLPPSIPADSIRENGGVPSGGRAVFFGALYGVRQQYLDHPSLKKILVRPEKSLEMLTEWPAQYDALQESIGEKLANRQASARLLELYLKAHRFIRKQCFDLWLGTLNQAPMVVNLPQYGCMYSGRVVESMAAGRPVIAARLPERPLTQKLFEENKEILLYKGDNPEELADHIQRLLCEPAFGRQIAENARLKIKCGHRVEDIVRDILKWIDQTGALQPRKVQTAGIYRSSLDPSPLSEPQQDRSDRETPDSDQSREHGFLTLLQIKGLWSAGKPLRLHLGCGEQRLAGYINIDFPPSEHRVMRVAADVHADILKLEFRPGQIDEIRLHHVFEHFNRATALALLIKWHRWLKIDGKLVIETPDLIGSARTLLAPGSWKIKAAVVRHLSGDQTAPWGYHVDQWFAQRFEVTLKRLGFDRLQLAENRWNHSPFLSNVTVSAYKTSDIPLAVQLEAAESLLRDSMVSDAEGSSFAIWVQQLRDWFETGPKALAAFGSDAVTIPDVPTAAGPSRPLSEILNFNQNDRDKWVRAKAQQVGPGARVLDIGAGTCPYRDLFAHCDYKTHDFKKYLGEKLGGRSDYGKIDYVSEITHIPVVDRSFDLIICTEVLEHVPEPAEALREMYRILKPGGRLLLTAPLGSGLHQLPYHYYGGFTPEWYRHFCGVTGLELLEIIPNGGFFKLLSQECARFAWMLDRHPVLQAGDVESIRSLFGEWIPRYLYGLDDKLLIDQFTVGYHVECRRPESDSVNAQANARPNQCVDAMRGNAPEKKRPRATLGVVFSKDRALQLDGLLRSFSLHCLDSDQVHICVLYTTTTTFHEEQYRLLKQEHPNVELHRENNFKDDLLAIMEGCACVLFLVDDTVFINDFRMEHIAGHLESVVDSIGMSLRLGRNTTYCYPLNRKQTPPEFTAVDGEVLSYDWTSGACDFGYPLEVSSSVYRSLDLAPLLRSQEFRHPNGLEAMLHNEKCRFRKPRLLLFERPVAFSAPLNAVQEVCRNRAGRHPDYSVERLAELYNEGFRVDVKAYSGLTLEACHQEVTLETENASDRGHRPVVSVVIPCYEQALYLPEAVDSVAQQIYRDWEIVIVNDGSHDDTFDVAQMLIQKYSGKRIRYLYKNNGGLADARNFGIFRARGKYILPLDADDKLHPEMLLRTVGFLVAHPHAAIVYTDLLRFGADSKRVTAGDYDFQKLRYANQLNYCSLFRRETWRAVGGYNTNMTEGYEDWDFWIGCGEKGFFAQRIPEALFYYRVKNGSMYTRALENDRKLKAQIVLNHPGSYSRSELDWACAVTGRSKMNDPQPCVHAAQAVAADGLRQQDVMRPVVQ